MKSGRVQWLSIGALLFALLTTVFAVVNMDRVRVNFLFVETNAPLILVIVISTVLGGLIVGLFGILRQVQMSKEIRELRKKLGASPSSPGTSTSLESSSTPLSSTSALDRDDQLPPKDDDTPSKRFGSRRDSGAGDV
ncbi:lipopolysaccharide assembly LapA domain-containing protein [Paenibacillus sp. FJAT-26967]|uniref:LapA family protein n=1 Tax=Paenibacillus sp. FJAT-26967 TaxID=1729690 RepID=UPI0008388A73|nr:lipopolysaccharide assembly protein LapA domain-containing protein [Paenibacillus sp. FJAT-26967]